MCIWIVAMPDCNNQRCNSTDDSWNSCNDRNNRCSVRIVTLTVEPGATFVPATGDCVLTRGIGGPCGCNPALAIAFAAFCSVIPITCGTVTVAGGRLGQ